MKKLRTDFTDVLKSGGFKQSGPLPAESDETDLAGLNRLIFRHRRRNFGRLRELIDVLNG